MSLREKLIAAVVAALAAFLGALGGGAFPPRVPVTPPPTSPPHQHPPAEPAPQPAIDKTIARIQTGSSGCTGALVGPRRVDRRYNLLTAAHCVDRVGQRGTYFAQDGSRLTFEVVGINRKADACWCLTDPTDKHYPFAELADEEPEQGTPVWHAGYGIDRPGNREDGTVVTPLLADGKTHFYLSVSSGDSGGAIVHAKTGKILSVVCCSDAAGRKGNVYGAGVTAIRQLRDQHMHDPEWTPIPVPHADHHEKKVEKNP